MAERRRSAQFSQSLVVHNRYTPKNVDVPVDGARNVELRAFRLIVRAAT